MKPKRILYVSQFSYIGGGEKSLLLVMKNLDRSRWEPFLACYTEGALAERARLIPVPVKVIRASGMFREFIALAGLTRIIKRRRIDCVHVNCLDIRSAVAGLICGVPVIGHLRVIFPMTWRDRLFARISRMIIAVSGAAVSAFRDAASYRFTVIPNAVEKPPQLVPIDLKREYGFPCHFRAVGTIGRFDEMKGFDYFIEACALIKKGFSDSCFFLIGSPENEAGKKYREKLQLLANNAGLAGSLVFAGFKEDILGAIAGLDVAVVPSIYKQMRQGKRGEGFGRVAAEAMAVNVPVVASRSGGLVEIIEDGKSGILVPPQDAQAIADAVLGLFRDPRRVQEMKRQEQKRFEELFTVGRHMRLLERVYEDVLGLDTRRVCPVCGNIGARVVESSEQSDYRVLRCLACSFTFVWPQPEQIKLAENYSAEYYEPWIGKQSRARQGMWKKRLSLLDSFAGRKGSLLDAGCGEGSFLTAAKKEGWQVTGTEISAFACEKAEQTGIKAWRGQLQELGLKEKSFDAITAWHVLEHVPEPMAFLKEARRLVREDGVFILAVPNLDCLPLRWAYRLFKGKRLVLFDPGNRELHLSFFSKQTITLALARAGFRVESVTADHGIIDPARSCVDMFAGLVSAFSGRMLSEAIMVKARPAEVK